MTYFKNCQTLEELKKEYKKLAVKNHPDNGGSAETMKAINAEYEQMFNILKKQHNATADEKHQAKESAHDFMDVIEKIIFCEGLEIEICGTWIWVTGETFKHKDILKDAGFKWCSNKKAWAWHPADDGFTANRKRKTTMAEIRFKYGSEKVETKKRTYIA